MISKIKYSAFFLYPGDVLKILTLFIISVFVNYYLPQGVNLIFQLILLFLFYRDNKNYLWFAFLFIIINEPGGLFTNIEFESSNAFALLRNTPVGILYFWLAFILVALLKSLNKGGNRYPFFLRLPIFLLLLYFVLLFMIFGINKVPGLIRGTLPWTFLIIIPAFFTKIEDYVKFFNIIFHFVFVTILFQIYNILTGVSIGKQIGDSQYASGMDLLINGELLRPSEGITIPFIALLGATFFLSYKKQYFKKNFLYIIISAALLSILITATRGWILASLFIVAFSFIMATNNKLKSIIIFAITSLFIILSISAIPELETQTDLAFGRFETISLLIKGDITAGGTLHRLDERAPRVMKKFEESPIIGNGFGPEAVKYSDGHVGNHNLLMHTGIIGFGLFLLLWISFIIKLFERSKTLTKVNPFQNTHIPLMLFLLGLIIIHSTSAQVFGLGFNITSGFMVFFLFSFANFVYWEALREEKRLKLKDQNNLTPTKK